MSNNPFAYFQAHPSVSQASPGQSHAGQPPQQGQQQQQSQQSAVHHYAAQNPSQYQPAASEIHVAPYNSGPVPGPSGPQGVGLGGAGGDADHPLANAFGDHGQIGGNGGLSPDSNGGADGDDAPDPKKKGGRPRDKVWELFEGDREIAKCRFCDWKTEHPKAFRMRAHAATCEEVPQDAKERIARYQEEKDQRAQLRREAQQESGSATGTPTAVKKPKRSHDSSSTPASGAQPIFNPRMPPAAALRSPITCHVLDSTSGKPAPEMRIRLDRLNTTGFVLQAQGMTDMDGRCNTLLPAGTRVEVGIFKITFFTNEYFTKRGILSFYPFVEIPFEVKSADEHYHIPCLLSPYSYTTYRGS